jgi:hypothetical protein
MGKVWGASGRAIAIGMTVLLSACKTAPEWDELAPRDTADASTAGAAGAGRGGAGNGGAVSGTGGNGAVAGIGATGGVGGVGATGGTGAAGAPAQPWKPHFDLGTPGWRNSTTPFCTERFGGIRGPQVWSDDGTVFALVSATAACGEDYAPCGGQGSTVYSNSGRGWATLQRLPGSNLHVKLAGFPGGSLLLDDLDCGIRIMDRSGNTRCMFEDTRRIGVRDLFAAGDGSAYALIGGELMKLTGETWAPFGNVKTVDYSGAVWGDSGRIVLVDSEKLAVQGDASGRFVALPNAPSAWFSEVWVSGKDVWLADQLGVLHHFDGTRWRSIDTGLKAEILGLWGSRDGVLYFYSGAGFGRWNGAAIELFAIPPSGLQFVAFSSIWGNSASEVFVGVQDLLLRKSPCSGSFILFFDGKQFHRF